MLKKIVLYYLITVVVCFFSIFINSELAFVFGSMLGTVLGGSLLYLPIIYVCGKSISDPRTSAGLSFILSIVIFCLVQYFSMVEHVSYTSSYGNSYGSAGAFLAWVWIAIISGLLSRQNRKMAGKTHAAIQTPLFEIT
jgi:hypothetical protein